MLEKLRQAILSLPINEIERENLLKEVKLAEKLLESADFRYNRTMMDKNAITNILNASIAEIEKQKSVINKQKKEALNRASIDRFRAEISSMQTAKDLDRFTPLIWDELKILEIPFIRSGIILIDEDDNHNVGIYLSTPDGTGIAAFKLPAYKTPFSQKIFDYWKSKEDLIEHWDADTFSAWAKSLVDIQAIDSDKKYLTDHPPQNLHLHFLPFEYGMLYVGNTEPLDKEKLALVRALAIAFSTAYTRYDDYIKLETAKKLVDQSLAELKQAQQLLVQSEKMASLGELTAGIAHEIQNPLNFVNNFSDVNKELADELIEELAKGDMQLANEISTDIKSNSEKINFHGQRASAIVKSMLQHSRKSEGQKELTDINALCDEYLRLSYHGLRAKDKSFNAKFEMDFDAALPKIKVVPQDLGRVILNLINNAFYAVLEKQKSAAENYLALVTISTRLMSPDKNGWIEISVKDNGNGIPNNVKEKIFQPFFTTKPTGSGTGLGLSLSYDIVKAHGGEIWVESKEGEGTVFKVKLPII